MKYSNYLIFTDECGYRAYEYDGFTIIEQLDEKGIKMINIFNEQNSLSHMYVQDIPTAFGIVKGMIIDAENYFKSQGEFK